MQTANTELSACKVYLGSILKLFTKFCVTYGAIYPYIYSFSKFKMWLFIILSIILIKLNDRQINFI